MITAIQVIYHPVRNYQHVEPNLAISFYDRQISLMPEDDCGFGNKVKLAY